MEPRYVYFQDTMLISHKVLKTTRESLPESSGKSRVDPASFIVQSEKVWQVHGFSINRMGKDFTAFEIKAKAGTWRCKIRSSDPTYYSSRRSSTIRRCGVNSWDVHKDKLCL